VSEKVFKKDDAGKLRWDLIPEEAMEDVVKVLMYGARYGEWNWLDNADQVHFTRYLNAMERHFKAIKRGQDKDPESGRQHLSHIITNALFLSTYITKALGIDNRRKDLK
jgi:hypothetical protein